MPLAPFAFIIIMNCFDCHRFSPGWVMKLHCSQTQMARLIEEVVFDYHMKLHCSQTSICEQAALHSACNSHGITAISL